MVGAAESLALEGSRLFVAMRISVTSSPTLPTCARVIRCSPLGAEADTPRNDHQDW